MDVNKWFGELPHPYKIVIAGNHDRSLGRGDKLGFSIFTNTYYLQNTSIEVDGINIYGSPNTPWKNQMLSTLFAFGYVGGNKDWKEIPKNTDILITHCPPYGFGDLLAEGSSEPNTHIGDKKLLDRINKTKPKLSICGHIHEGYGVRDAKDTTFINASSVDENYNLVNPIITTFI